MEKNRLTGIVLQAHLPVKRVVVVLDNALGKIEVIPARGTTTHLARGFLISYQLEHWRSMWIAQAVEIAAVPAPWVRYDIAFIHQLIELCLVYSPFNQAEPLVFEVLDLLYKNSVEVVDTWKKKVLLCKLLLLLGFYPGLSSGIGSGFLYKELYNLINLPVGALFGLHYPTEYITLELDAHLTRWLEDTLLVTQEYKQLKTFSFGSVCDE